MESKFIAAIRALSDQNRLASSPEIEAELVRLRIEAGRALLHRGNPGMTVQPGPADVFSGTTGIPEIGAGDLSADALASGILHHGALLVRGLYNQSQVDRLLEVSSSQDEGNRLKNNPLGCTAHTLFELIEIYRECGLLDAVRHYLVGEPVMFAERTKLRHHRAERDKYAAIPWHQDVNFFGMKSCAVNCWAAVTSIGEGNPGLGIIPRRVDERVGWKEEDGIAPLEYGKAIPPDVLHQLVTKSPAVYPVLRPGDALLFDEMTVHQTAVRRWELADQIVTISWFFPATGFPEWGTPLAV